jgi:hypothetical protein
VITFIIICLIISLIGGLFLRKGIDSFEDYLKKYFGDNWPPIMVLTIVATLICGMGFVLSSAIFLIVFNPWVEASKQQYDLVIKQVEEHPELNWRLQEAKKDGMLSLAEFHEINGAARNGLDEARNKFTNFDLEAEQ